LHPTIKDEMDNIVLFETLCSGPNFYKLGPYCFEFRPSGATKTLSLVALVHGNESGGLDILNEVLKLITNEGFEPLVNIRFLLGNVNAYLSQKRFIETDLNRSFEVPNPESLEEIRGREISQLVKGSDFLIDFHQTIEPCHQPFFIFTYTEKSFSLARALDDSVSIVTFKSFSNAVLGKGLTTMANNMGTVAITIETGQKGKDKNQIEFGSKLIFRATEILEKNINLTVDKKSLANVFTWGETIMNPGFHLELIQKFKNFDFVSKHQEIARFNDVLVTSRICGPVLFPKYDEMRFQSQELIRILKPLISLEDLT